MSTEVRIPLRSDFYEVERSTYDRTGEIVNVTYTLSPLGRSLVEVPENVQQKLRRRVITSYKIAKDKDGVVLMTREQGFGRGLINRLLNWPVYSVTQGGTEADITRCLQSMKNRFIRTNGSTARSRRLDFIHFESLTDAAQFRLSMKSGVTNVYRVKNREEIATSELEAAA